MSGGQGQNPYGMGGYGYMQQGNYPQQQGGYDYQAQQAWQQQQMAYMQQQYGQQQGQWGGQQQGYNQQQQMYAQQQQHQQQQGQQQGFGGNKGGGGKGGGDKGGGGGGGKSSGGGDKGGGGKGGGGGGGGKDAIRTMMNDGRDQAPKAAAKKKPTSEMTLEEYQAAEAEKKAKKAAERKEKEAAAKAAAAARMAGGFDEEPAAPVQVLRKEEKAEAAPAPAPEPPAPEPKKEEPKKEEPEEEVDDWEQQADEEEAPAAAEEPPAPAPAPVKEAPPPAKEVVEEKAPPPAAEKSPPKAEKQASKVEEEEEEVAEEEPPKDESSLKDPDPRLHLNVVFIGHVDAGKSTTCGNILFLSNCVDERTVEKYMKEAKDKNRESWFLAYIMDTNDEEKAKGKTVEVGRAHFETENRRFTILDAPGHKSYVPNMIAGASQADIGVLIISARKGEFETGFERGGQTREHALLAKTLGVEKLLLCINKMDDDSVQWAQERYDEIQKKMSPFLKQNGFKEDQVIFLPISGLKGHNIKERLDTPAWFKGDTLLKTLDTTNIPRGNKDGHLRIPMLDGYRDMGAIMAIGKVEQGTVKPGAKCMVMPIGAKCTVHTVNINDEAMKWATTGENVTLKMTGVSEDQLSKGFVLCNMSEPARVVTKFKAMLQVIELPEERPVLTAGYRAVIHVHVANEECEILKLYEACSMKDMKKKEKKPKFVRENSVAWVSIQLARPTAVDAFTGCSQLGRFTLRDEGRTIAIGKITELPTDKDDDKKK